MYDGNMWIVRVGGPGVFRTLYDPLLYSYDGIKWKVLVPLTNFPDELSDNWFGPGGNLLYTWNKYFMYNDSINTGYYSYDLFNWIKHPNTRMDDLFYDNKIYLRGSMNYGAGMGVVGYSYNGINFKLSNAASFMIDTSSICGNGDIYIASGNSNTNSPLYSIIYSYNGITWYGISNSLNFIRNGYSQIIWNGTIFVCVGTAGTNSNATSIAKSSDGINWVSCPTPTSSAIARIDWNNNVWIINTGYFSYDLINWTARTAFGTIGIKQTRQQEYKGYNLFSSSNSLYRYYGSSKSEFTNINEIQICYGQTTVGADSTINITNLPYESTLTYFAIAQVSSEPIAAEAAFGNFTYGQAQIISASTIRLYNQDSTRSHTVMWKTIGY
jgi:hypothetical protein